MTSRLNIKSTSTFFVSMTNKWKVVRLKASVMGTVNYLARMLIFLIFFCLRNLKGSNVSLTRLSVNLYEKLFIYFNFAPLHLLIWARSQFRVITVIKEGAFLSHLSKNYFVYLFLMRTKRNKLRIENTCCVWLKTQRISKLFSSWRW